MSKFYSIEVKNEDNGKVYAYADGDIEVVSYVGRKAIADIKDVTTDVRLSLIEVDEIGQEAEETRSIAKLTADAGTVSYVLKAKLSAERKLAKAAGPSDVADNADMAGETLAHDVQEPAFS